MHGKVGERIWVMGGGEGGVRISARGVNTVLMLILWFVFSNCARKFGLGRISRVLNCPNKIFLSPLVYIVEDPCGNVSRFIDWVNDQQKVLMIIFLFILRTPLRFLLWFHQDISRCLVMWVSLGRKILPMKVSYWIGILFISNKNNAFIIQLYFNLPIVIPTILQMIWWRKNFSEARRLLNNSQI